MEQIPVSSKRPYDPPQEEPFVKFAHGVVPLPLRSAPVAELSLHPKLPEYKVIPAGPSPGTVPPEYFSNTEQRGEPSTSSKWKLSDLLPALPPFPPLPRGLFKG